MISRFRGSNIPWPKSFEGLIPLKLFNTVYKDILWTGVYLFLHSIYAGFLSVPSAHFPSIM
jgi:hypothetical protein